MLATMTRLEVGLPEGLMLSRYDALKDNPALEQSFLNWLRANDDPTLNHSEFARSDGASVLQCIQGHERLRCQNARGNPLFGTYILSRAESATAIATVTLCQDPVGSLLLNSPAAGAWILCIVRPGYRGQEFCHLLAKAVDKHIQQVCTIQERLYDWVVPTTHPAAPQLLSPLGFDCNEEMTVQHRNYNGGRACNIRIYRKAYRPEP